MLYSNQCHIYIYVYAMFYSEYMPCFIVSAMYHMLYTIPFFSSCYVAYLGC